MNAALLMYGNLSDKIDSIAKHVNEIDLNVQEKFKHDAEFNAINTRVRILEFGDGLLHNRSYSKERFEQALSDIKNYEKYCKEHPDFQNDVAYFNILAIKEAYAECLKNQSFLPYGVPKMDK